MTFLLYGAFGAAMLLIPYVLITSGGYSPVQAGLAMLPLPILMTSVSPTMGELAARIGPRLPLTVGPLVVAAGMVLGRADRPDSSYWTGAFPTISVMAVGMAIAVAPLTSSVLGSVEEQHVAMASGFNSAVARHRRADRHRTCSASSCPGGRALIAGFHGAMVASAIVAAAASAAAWFSLRSSRNRRRGSRRRGSASAG